MDTGRHSIGTPSQLNASQMLTQHVKSVTCASLRQETQKTQHYSPIRRCRSRTTVLRSSKRKQTVRWEPLSRWPNCTPTLVVRPRDENRGKAVDSSNEHVGPPAPSAQAANTPLTHHTRDSLQTASEARPRTTIPLVVQKPSADVFEAYVYIKQTCSRCANGYFCHHVCSASLVRRTRRRELSGRVGIRRVRRKRGVVEAGVGRRIELQLFF